MILTDDQKRLDDMLRPVWDKIVEVENKLNWGNIGTGLQMDLEAGIRPLLPAGVGYNFYFDMSGHTQHVFYEINNPENQLVI